MAAKKKTTQKQTASQTRKLKSPTHRSFRLSSKKIKKPSKLPKARKILRTSVAHLWAHKKLFGGITAIYLVATILFVKGLSSANDIPEIKRSLEEILTGASGQLATGFALFGFMLGSASGVNSDVAGVYQMILLVIVSLALIWALRQTHAKSLVGIRESFYRGMYPLIPFLVVLFIIGIQFIPLAIGSWLFNITVVSGLAVTAPEVVLWSIMSFLLALLSVYMVSSSVFALYISTLPDMTPMKALRSARQLVMNRRWEILRKVLYLPLVILVVGALITVPVILLLTPLAEWVFFILSMAALAVSHSYVYSLYRELL